MITSSHSSRLAEGFRQHRNMGQDRPLVQERAEKKCRGPNPPGEHDGLGGLGKVPPIAGSNSQADHGDKVLTSAA